MRFLAIQNKDRGILAALIVQDLNGKISYTAYNKWYGNVLGLILSRGRFFIEEKPNNRTVVKKQIPKEDPRYFEVLKTKISAPYVAYASGDILAKNPDEAIKKLWAMFSPKENREVVGI